MLNINVITVGKLKESYLRDACAEYEKRLGAYSTIKVIELAESRLPDSPAQKEIANALENEADMILKKITPQSAVIAMCIEGKMMSSEDFSHKLEGFALVVEVDDLFDDRCGVHALLGQLACGGLFVIADLLYRKHNIVSFFVFSPYNLQN